MPVTVAAQSLTVVKSSSIVRTAAGRGVSRTHTAVTIPSVPSDPTTTPRRSSPANSGASDPTRTTSPFGSTTSSASTWAEVTPYARQCGPPAFVFTLPPIEEVCWLDGSGANVNPCGCSAADRSRFGTPGSTHARRSSGRTSRTAVIFVVTTTSASPMGVDAPASPVPDPRGTTARPWSAAARTHATTSCVDRGNATSSHDPSTMEASRA